MEVNELNAAQLRQQGIEALVNALGALGMVRFLQQFDPGSGDYTRDRSTLLADISLADAFGFAVSQRIAQIRQTRAQ